MAPECGGGKRGSEVPSTIQYSADSEDVKDWSADLQGPSDGMNAIQNKDMSILNQSITPIEINYLNKSIREFIQVVA